MKNTIKLLGIIVFTALIVFSTAACKGKDKAASNADSAPAAAAVTTDSPPAAVAGSLDPASINNWDTFIKEYDNFMMNEYIPLVTKMKAGDISVFAELQPLQAKFSEWGQQMQAFALKAGEPTEEQQQKMEAIIEKINTALEE